MTYMFYTFAMGDCHGPYQESPDYGQEDEGEHDPEEKNVYGMEWIDTDPDEMRMIQGGHGRIWLSRKLLAHNCWWILVSALFQAQVWNFLEQVQADSEVFLSEENSSRRHC